MSGDATLPNHFLLLSNQLLFAVLPTKYVSGSNAEVLIMTNQGKIVLKTNDYLNNWPEEQLNLNSVNKLYYYIIKTTNERNLTLRIC